jgi:hypothetical protein
MGEGGRWRVEGGKGKGGTMNMRKTPVEKTLKPSDLRAVIVSV